MNNKKLEVVIDAANIIHVDVVNKEGQREIKITSSELSGLSEQRLEDMQF